ncbi:MAG: 7,8-dihydroneopterin aldolase/epimerase/oxygenase [Variibacter sp.]|nr:7,8-dihydroneopterin aldolase/epimerase/oxygenase [Variibacter sp.]
MSDTIFIERLVVHAHHGVGEDERQIGQQFLLDLHLDVDLSAAGDSDKLVDTVSYADIIEVASEAFRSTRYRLVEAAATAVADAILDAFPRVEGLTIAVHKPHAPIAAVFSDVGVRLTRSRND